ncbi:hypothetical protein BEN49_04345 [Hymenobacter coccineus]|uniref:Uncharacterized protein n=1 Tax=Hymenobacter coccineus TaxID=1908235 RepID=A0A1G1TL98_9BACT|nr:hypothetical protein BEN49_04345 [Hymenobacter coccineus]
MGRHSFNDRLRGQTVAEWHQRTNSVASAEGKGTTFALAILQVELVGKGSVVTWSGRAEKSLSAWMRWLSERGGLKTYFSSIV